VHIALHKPRGYSCSHNRGEAPVLDELLPPALRECGLQPVGRLDRDTSGLLILTTDGRLNHALTCPANKVEKQYRIGFRGVLSATAAASVAAGIQIEGDPEPTLPAQLVVERVTRFRSAVCEEELGEATLVLREGRHHQVRRMFRALRANVVTLHRERIGGIVLPPGLVVGDFVELPADARFVEPADSAARSCPVAVGGLA